MSYPPISSEQLPTTSTNTISNNTATTAPSTTATQSIGSSSASPQPPSSTTAPNIPTIHKRTYQACIPCRQRKVRCDLGSVEAPHSPPCVRCRRESKDCFFSATRRKTRTSSTTVIPRGGSKTIGTVGRCGGILGSGYVAKREYMDDGSTIYDPVDDGDGESVSTGSMLSRGSVRKKQKVGGEEDDDLFSADTAYRLPPPIIEPPLRHESQHRSTHVPPPLQNQTHHNQQAASVSRERLLQGEVYNSHDALHLLFEAAGRGASGPSSPKPKSDSGENDEDEDEQDDDDGEDDDHDNDHVMGEAQTNDAMRSTMITSPTNRTTEIGNSYPTKYDDVDGRASSINPISHFNGSISTSTSFLRGTGRPGTAKPAPPQETTQAATKVNNPPTVTPTSPISTRSGNTQQPAQPTGIRNRTSFSQRSAASEKSSIHGEDREGLQAALKAWGKSRFVKSGWFTAREAIKYVDYFFEHHHPLSPLLTTSYAQHSTHPTLLQYEPFLATTLLAIASRYVHLPGPGGHSRSYAIHDMLWRELRRGLESVIWGGGGGGPPSRGGLAGLGNSPGKGLRTLGTVEALMVLTEWHVRNLHFPVGGEGGWGAFDGVFGNENDEEEGEGGSGSSIGETFPHRRHHHKGSIAGRRARERHRGVVEGLGDRIENILEPAWRSDRMSWMLLGNALTLSYELGVFDDLDEPISSVSTPQSVATPSSTSHAQQQTANSITGQSVPHLAPQTAYRLRCRRIQKLLVVYVTQLASRLGWTSMIPKNITDSLGYKGQFSGSQSHLFAAAGAVAFPYNLSKPDSRPGTGGATSIINGTHTSAPGSTTSPKTTNIPVNGSGIPIIPRTPTELQDTVFQCWVDLTMLMKYCGEQCFPSRVGTRDLMRSGKYVSVLETLRPILRGWKEGFEAFGFPTPIHNILTLEYEHVRMYINSLALQAIIDRCTTTSVQPPPPQPAAGKDAKQRKSSSSHSTSEQPSFAVLMKTNPTDLDFVTEVVDASRCVLTTVVERMASTGELKHAPVRIYLRILSAAMFLLKTFALGAKEDDITVSLELMDQTVEVLRRESCDDVHLGLRFGELLETLTKRVRMRFVRMQGGSRGDSPAPMEGGNGNGHAKGIGERGLMGVNRGLQSAVANGEANAAEELTGYGNGTNGAPITGGADFGEQQAAAKGEENSDELAGSSSNNNSHLLAPSSTSSGMLMPPPPHPAVFPYFDPSDPTATNPSYFNPAGFEDWLALPIDPIMGWSGSSGSEHTFLGGVMGSSTGSGGGSGGSGHGGSGGGAGSSGGGGRSGYGGGSSVTQTQMGPDVGGYDLLELLLGSDQAGGGGAGMGDL